MQYRDVLTELKDSQQAMDEMMARHNQQTELVQSMTEQVQKSETKLHTFKVQEAYEKRKALLEQKLRDDASHQAISEKDRLLNELSVELVDTKDRLGNIRNNLEGGGGNLNRSIMSGYGSMAGAEDRLIAQVQDSLNRSALGGHGSVHGNANNYNGGGGQLNKSYLSDIDNQLAEEDLNLM